MDIWGILEYTISATVIGLLICLIKLIFHDKLDARWHYFIWLMLLVRLAVPGRILKIPVSLSVFQEIPIGKWLEMARILVEKKGLGDLFRLLGRIYLWGTADFHWGRKWEKSGKNRNLQYGQLLSGYEDSDPSDS